MKGRAPVDRYIYMVIKRTHCTCNALRILADITVLFLMCPLEQRFCKLNEMAAIKNGYTVIDVPRCIGLVSR